MKKQKKNELFELVASYVNSVRAQALAQEQVDRALNDIEISEKHAFSVKQKITDAVGDHIDILYFVVGPSVVVVTPFDNNVSIEIHPAIKE
jgi:tetrahydromethanopterin S-methyltransferase subunit G